MLGPDLLEIICCPLGKASLKYENDSLICSRCGLIFPIIEDIPSLLIDEAKLPEGISSLVQLSCQKEKVK